MNLALLIEFLMSSENVSLLSRRTPSYLILLDQRTDLFLMFRIMVFREDIFENIIVDVFERLIVIYQSSNHGLIYKLISMEIPSQLVSIIKSFLSIRSFHVKRKDQIPSFMPIKAGVPQRFCLAPRLFFIYISDMSQDPKSNIVLFVDDTLYYAKSNTFLAARNHLQKQLNLVQPWFDK